MSCQPVILRIAAHAYEGCDCAQVWFQTVLHVDRFLTISHKVTICHDSPTCFHLTS